MWKNSTDSGLYRRKSRKDFRNLAIIGRKQLWRTSHKKRSGSFVNCVAIDRNDNNRQSILPHIHENRLELFYVCSGNGQYMVDNRYYPIGKGDIVICNQGVLHGEEPEQVRQIRSYSVALTGVQVQRGCRPTV